MLPDGIARLFRLGRRQDVVAEVDEEIAFHLDAKTEALVTRGMNRDAAREEALRSFGDMRSARADLIRTDRSEAETRQRREWRGDWWMDIRHGARSLAHTPGLTAAIVVILALGIGANAAMLGILDRLLLRPPPYLAEPANLVRVALTYHLPNRPDFTRSVMSYADLADFVRDVPALSVAGYSHPQPVSASEDDEEKVARVRVTQAFFPVLGASAQLGRTFDSSDVANAPVVVLSDAYWRRRYASNPRLLGQSVAIGKTSFVVVGVMPRGFTGAEVNAADAWTLVEQVPGDDWRTSRNTGWLEVIGRLKSADGRAAAVAQVEGVRRALAMAEGHRLNESVELGSIIPGRRSSFDGAGVRLSIAVAVVSALLLLIAVANVTNLLLVRAVTRQREFSVRAALGAGRGRLVRSVLIESVLLACAGGVAAAVVGHFAGIALRELLLPGYRWATPPLGLLPGLVAAALSLAIGLVAGLVPGLHAGREAALGALRTGVQRGRGARAPLRSALVSFQVAVSVMLVAGTALYVRSLAKAQHEDHGLALRGMVELEIDAQQAVVDELRGDLENAPGVSAVTVTTAAPMRRLDFATLRVDGRDTTLFSMKYSIPEGFLAAAGLRLRAGRGFTADDRVGSERVAVVDSVLEARYWPGERATGRCVYMDPDRSCVRVVGVVAHVRSDGLRDQFDPQVYFPLSQVPARGGYALLLRTNGVSAALLESVWRAVARRVPGFRRSGVRTYDEMLAPQLQPWRVGVILFSAAAALALLLSSIGTFAVMAFAVRQRTHEFGVRRALGASSGSIIRLVLGEGAVVAGSGVVLGVALAWGAGRFAAPLLYQGNPHDPVALGVAGAGLLGVALAAASGAAGLALRADPRQALQAD